MSATHQSRPADDRPEILGGPGPVHILANNKVGAIRDIALSPNEPHVAVVIYEAMPPEFFDLRKAEVPNAIAEMRCRFATDPCFLDDDCRLKIPCSLPAKAVAFRPGQGDEIALALGDESDLVYRFDAIKQKRLAPVVAENACALCYSLDGSLLAIGSLDGNVLVYKVDGADDEPELLGQVNVGNLAILTLCFEKNNDQLRIATDGNAYIRLEITGYDNGTWEQSALTFEDGAPEAINLKINHITCCPETGLLGFGGIGPEIWIFNPEYGQGKMIKSAHQQQIRKLQFIPGEDKLLAIGDFGIETISFYRNCFDLPEEPRWISVFESPKDAVVIVSAYRYGDTLCVALSCPW